MVFPGSGRPYTGRIVLNLVGPLVVRIQLRNDRSHTYRIEWNDFGILPNDDVVELFATTDEEAEDDAEEDLMD